MNRTARFRTSTALSAFFCALMFSAAASAQTAPAIERVSGVCIECTPDGWTILTESPDVIVGDGTWPGGGYTVAEVGGALHGSTVAFLLHNNGGVSEGIQTTVTGLVPLGRYRYRAAAQGCLLYNSSFTYTAEGATLELSVNGTTQTLAGSSNDAWTDIVVEFEANASGNATITAAMGLTDSPTGYGTCMVIDSDVDALTNVTSVTLEVPTLTNDDTPTIGGTAAPNYVITVEIRDGSGTLIQTLNTTANAQTVWSVDATMLNDGIYQVSASAADSGGGDASTAGPSTLEVDTTPPTTTIVAPASNTSTNTLIVSGTSEPGATVLVELLDTTGIVVASDTPTTNMAGEYESIFTPNDGTYSVRVTGTDAAGNSADTTNTNVTLDTTPPQIAVSTPSSGATANTSTVAVSGTTEPNLEVLVVITDTNGTVLGSETVVADANGDWTAMVTGITDGDVNASATTSDAAGNPGQSSEVSFVVDTVMPMVSITAPEDDAVLNVVLPTFEGTISAEAMLGVELRDSANTLVPVEAAAIDMAGNWTFEPSNDLNEGTYTLDATALRSNGLTAAAQIEFTIDLTAPTTIITNPANGMVTNENQPTITGTTEPNSEITVVITDQDGNVVFETTVTADENGEWMAALDGPLDDGLFTIDATGVDAAGNLGESAEATIEIDATAPMVAIVSPLNGDSFELGTAVTVEIRDDGLLDLELLVDDTSVASTAGSDGSWSVTLDGDNALAVGSHTLEALAVDQAGNIASSGVVTISIVEAAPVEDEAPDENPIYSGGAEDGCGCATPASQTEGKVGWLLLLMGAFFMRRRRR